MMSTAFDLLALHRELEAERSARGLSKQRLAEAVGVSASAMARAANGGTMEADGVLAMVRWLGVAPERFIRPVVRDRPTAPLTSSAAMVRADPVAMRRALDRRRLERGLSWVAVTEELGPLHSGAALAGLREGGRTTIATLAAVAVWLGVPIANLTRESTC